MYRIFALPVAAFLAVGAGPPSLPLETAQANAPKQIPPKTCKAGIMQRLYWFRVSKDGQGNTIVLFRGFDKSSAYEGLPEPPDSFKGAYPYHGDVDPMGRITFTSLKGAFVILTPIGATYHVELRGFGQTDAKC